jgi:hypothetical protein
MTPLPTPDELAARHIFDLLPGTLHIHDLVAMAKDSLYIKDKVSDYVIRILLLIKETGVISL